MFEHCAAAGVKASVENPVAGGQRAAATVTCEFPGGRKVLANGIFDIHDGRIVREYQVLAGDASRWRRQTMPKASKVTASEHETVEGYEGHFEHFEGGWTVGFEAYTEDADLGAAVQGPSRRPVPCPHMGYVIRGKVGFRSGGGEELFEAGDAYYVGPGHTPVLYAGTEVVEFSPTEELGRTLEVVTRNMQQTEAASS